MHRSGTSVTSRLLNILGLYLGPEQHLMEAHPQDNPKGYWEHQPLTDLNDELLARLGGTWLDPPSFPAGWETSPALDDLWERARSLIEQDFSAHTLWGWKDPRTCLTLPFWRRLLGSMRYVLCFRNPLDVTRSLAQRYGTFEKGVHLWLTYVRSALEHTSEEPRLFVFYEDVLTGWDEQLRRLACFLERPERAQDPVVRRAAREFVEEELHHHRTSIVDFVGGPEVTFPAKALYVILRASALDGTRGASADAGPEMREVLRILSRQATEAQAVVALIGGIEKRIAQLMAERDGMAAESVGLRAALAERDRTLDASTAQLMAERDRLAAERDQFGAERDQLAAERDLLAAERDQLAAQRDQFGAERDQLAAERDLLAAERDQLATERDRLGSEREGLFAERQHLTEECRRSMEQASQLRAERDQLSEEGRRSLERASELAAERDRLSEEARRSLDQVGKLTAERDRLSEESRRFVVQTSQLAAERDRLCEEGRRSVERIDRLEGERDRLSEERGQLRQMLEHHQRVLATIQGSRLWRILGLYRRFVHTVLPAGSRRGDLYRSIVGSSSTDPRA